MNPHARIGIVGVGLLGGSLGMAARRLGLAQEVVGLGRSQANLDIALARGCVDRAGTSPEILRGADLVVLATPVGVLAKTVLNVSIVVFSTSTVMIPFLNSAVPTSHVKGFLTF